MTWEHTEVHGVIGEHVGNTEEQKWSSIILTLYNKNPENREPAVSASIDAETAGFFNWNSNWKIN